MEKEQKTENKGAWIVHHGRKIALDMHGAGEFPAIDEAAKAANLLTKLGETNQVTLTKEEVKAIAAASGLNPRYETDALLEKLQKKRLIDQSEKEVSVLGVTTRAALRHAVDLFEAADPSLREEASIELAEITSVAPTLRNDAEELVGDSFSLTTSETKDLIERARQIGFVDSEGIAQDQLLFKAANEKFI